MYYEMEAGVPEKMIVYEKNTWKRKPKLRIYMSTQYESRVNKNGLITHQHLQQ